MENHVVSLTLSKKLKEFGVPQRSEFYWKPMDAASSDWKIVDFGGNDSDYSAFLSSELGEMLPEVNWQTYKDRRKHIWVITNHSNSLQAQESTTEADARAKMLIHLIEHSIIDVKSL